VLLRAFVILQQQQDFFAFRRRIATEIARLEQNPIVIVGYLAAGADILKYPAVFAG